MMPRDFFFWRCSPFFRSIWKIPTFSKLKHPGLLIRWHILPARSLLWLVFSPIGLITAKWQKMGANRRSKEEQTCKSITTLESIAPLDLAASIMLMQLELNPSRRSSCKLTNTNKLKSDDNFWAHAWPFRPGFLVWVWCSCNKPEIWT